MNVTYSSHFDDMCKYCPYIDVEADVEHTKDVLGENELHVNVYCKNIGHCERVKEYCKNE